MTRRPASAADETPAAEPAAKAPRAAAHRRAAHSRRRRRTPAAVLHTDGLWLTDGTCIELD